MRLTRREFGTTALAALAGSAAGLTCAFAQAQKPTPPMAADVPWLAEVQTPPMVLPPDSPKLPSLLVDNKGNRLSTLAAWRAKRAELRREWLDLIGLWAPPRQPPVFQVNETDRQPKVTRQMIRYESEPGIEVEAYLLKPSQLRGKAPGVVVLHSTVDYTIRQGAGLEGSPSAAWGIRLAERGFVVICPRCFLWDGSGAADYSARVAEHQQRHPRSRGMAKMLYDGQRAIDVLVQQPEVDPQRIGVAGHSLGAKEAIYLAAFDERIKAAVASEGGVGRAFSNWEAPWYLGTRNFPREHHELLALVAPHAVLVIGGDSADGARSWPLVERAMEVYRLYGPPMRIGFYNHGQGHTIPPVAEKRVYEWLQTYL